MAAWAKHSTGRVPARVNHHLVLGGGLNAANVGEAIRQVRPRGLTLAVDVSSGVEQSKGIKDPHKNQRIHCSDAVPADAQFY